MNYRIYPAMLFALLTSLNAADPVAYTSLGAQDFIVTYLGAITHI